MFVKTVAGLVGVLAVASLFVGQASGFLGFRWSKPEEEDDAWAHEQVNKLFGPQYSSDPRDYWSCVSMFGQNLQQMVSIPKEIRNRTAEIQLMQPKLPLASVSESTLKPKVIKRLRKLGKPSECSWFQEEVQYVVRMNVCYAELFMYPDL